MSPDLDWRVDDDSGKHIVVKTSPQDSSRRRRILLGIVILLGISLGVIYSLSFEPMLKPTLTSIALQPTMTYRSALKPTVTTRPTRLYNPPTPPTKPVSPTSDAPALYPVSTSSNKLSLSSCLPTAGSAWRRWRSDPYPYAVRTLLLDQGQLWAGTATGLFNINPYTDQYTQTLPYETTGGISMLLPLGDGRLWAEGDRGHFYSDGRQWFQIWISGLSRNYTAVSRDRIVEVPVVEVALDKNSDLWIYQDTRDPRWPNLYHLPGHIPPSDRPWVAILEKPFWSDSDRCHWQAFTNGLSSYHSTADCETQNQTITSVGPYPTDAYYFPNMFSSATDRDGSVWWISTESPHYVLHHVANGRLFTSTLPTAYDTRGYQFTYPLAPDPIHGVWRGDGQGLVYTDGENTRRIDFAYDSCTVFWPNDLTIDGTGTIWLTTDQGQILKQASTEMNWTAVPLPGLAQNELKQPIIAITIDPAGSLWATHGYDLFNVGGAAFIKSVLPDAGCTLNHLVATAERVWGWGKCGVWQFDVVKQKWTHPKSGPNQAVLMVVDSNGTVYAGGPKGLYAYTDAAWQQVASVEVTAATADKQSGLWLASHEQGTLWHYKAGQLTSFGQPFDANGLIYLIVDSHNQLWAAYSDRLLRYDHGEWHTVSSPVFDIDRIAAGPDGRIWITGRYSTSSTGDASIAVYDPALDQRP